MESRDKKLIIAGLAICLIIAVLSPFIASSNPDGLEKSAEQIRGNTETEPVLESPMPDYTIESLGKLGEIGALALGALVTLILGYLIALILKRKNPPEASK